MPEICFYNDQKLFLKVQMAASTIRVGRSQECEVQLPKQHVSECHARIEPDETGEFWIENLSRTGTRVNDALIDQPTRLEPGNRIYIDDYVLVFRTDGEPAAALTAAERAH